MLNLLSHSKVVCICFDGVFFNRPNQLFDREGLVDVGGGSKTIASVTLSRLVTDVSMITDVV